MAEYIGIYEIIESLPSDEIYGWAIARGPYQSENIILQYLKLSLTPEQLNKLQTYFKKLQGIERPGIWTPKNYFSTQEVPLAVVYEYRETTHLLRKVKNDLKIASQWWEKAGEAVHALHNQGLVHGWIDIRNFVVAEGKVLLKGFGYGPHLEMGEPTALSVCHTSLAPEVRQKRELSKASDIYSFAVMIGQLQPELKKTSWYDKATAKEPQSRYTNIHQVTAALSQAIEQLQIEQKDPDKPKQPDSPLGLKAEDKIQALQAATQKLESQLRKLNVEKGIQEQTAERLRQENTKLRIELEKARTNLAHQEREIAENKKREEARLEAEKPKSNLKLSQFQTSKVFFSDSKWITINKSGEAQYYEEHLGNGVMLEMVYIPSGTYLMGAPDKEGESSSTETEKPQHRVNIKAFCLGKYPITQAQYEAIMGSNPSHFKAKNRPVERISWNDAQTFCHKLTAKMFKIYRLPSEAQWEYACRAGTTTPFYFGETLTTDLANYNGNLIYGNGPKGVDRKETTNVASFPPNAFGLYGMLGNVQEWCEDVWHESYRGAPSDGSAWTSTNDQTHDSSQKLLRGGSWFTHPRNCRSASRSRWNADYRDSHIGFRVVCSAS